MIPIRRLLLLLIGSVVILLLGTWWLHTRQQPVSHLVPFLNGNTSRVEKQLLALSDSAKIGQLLFSQPGISRRGVLTEETEKWISGLYLENVPLRPILYYSDSLQRAAALPIFCATNQPVLHNPAFSDTYPFPPPASWALQRDPELARQLDALYLEQTTALGLNLVVPFDLQQGLREGRAATDLLQELQARGVLTGAKGCPPYFPELPDTARTLIEAMQPLRALVQHGLSVLWIDQVIPGTAEYAQRPSDFYRDYLREQAGFEGLIIGVVREETPLSYLLQMGVDLFIPSDNPEKAYRSLQQYLRDGTLDRRTLRRNLRRILLAKNWMYGSHHPPGRSAQYSPLQIGVPESTRSLERLLQHFRGNDWGSFAYKLRSRTLQVVQNPQGLIPLTNRHPSTFAIWKTGRPYYPAFEFFFKKYGNYRAYTQAPGDTSTFTTAVVLIDDLSPSAAAGSPFRKKLDELQQKKPLVVLHFGTSAQVAQLDSSYTIIHSVESHPHTHGLAAELLFGAARVGAEADSSVPSGRIQFTPAVFDHAQSGRFQEVDQVMEQAIQRHYLPGGQVLLAVEGKILFHKSYGKHRYGDTTAVQTTDLYDIASLTKIAATTLLTMRYVDAGRLRLQDPIGSHVGWLRRTRVGAIPVWKLLTHQSGLQAAIPVYSYIRARTYSRRACDAYFCNRKTGSYQLEVAENLFFNKKYIGELKRNVSVMRPKKGDNYTYSDLNFWLLQQVLESIGGQSLAELVQAELYQPLGLRRTLYHPRAQIPAADIVPSAYDNTWRRQLLQGHVHDPTAAVIGGVSGHAGLFSTAEELAVLMQVLLQHGSYGGTRMFSEKVVRQFTEIRAGTRALGFDRPSEQNHFQVVTRAGRKTFGHTGFTGGCIWVDPKESAVYVFLSNRVYPNGRERGLVDKEIREKVMQAMYRGLAKESKNGLPDY